LDGGGGIGMLLSGIKLAYSDLTGPPQYAIKVIYMRRGVLFRE
jgi:hypothetical protein